MNRLPVISVIIPTYRRREYLVKVLDALATQTVPPGEVFVVDASPADEQLTDATVARYPGWLKYERYNQPGSASKQRNLALARCTGEILLFLDDDVEFGPELIANYLAAFRETGADGISGVVLLPHQQLCHEPKMVRTIPILRSGAPNYQAYDTAIDSYVICTASFAADRRAVLAAGGFDEQLTGTRDDVDLGLRLAKRGFRIVHHPGPQLVHLMAKGNGSRSPELGLQWAMANLFYFQFTHFWPAGRGRLRARTLWDNCRPSRHWLTPGLIVKRWAAVNAGYREALRRVNEGAKLFAPASEGR